MSDSFFRQNSADADKKLDADQVQPNGYPVLRQRVTFAPGELKLDEVSSVLLYLGEAAPNVQGSEALWRIRRIQKVGSDTCAVFGAVIVNGLLSTIEVGNDTAAVNGGAVLSAIIGSIAVTEVGDDTTGLVGDVFVKGMLNAVESGSDSTAIFGVVIASGGPVWSNPANVLSGIHYGPTGDDYIGTLVVSAIPSFYLDFTTSRMFKPLSDKNGILL